MSGLTGNNILAGSSGQVSGYEIEQSLRFEDGDSPYLTKTGTSADGKTFTLSAWVKRSNLPASELYYFSANIDGAEKQFRFGFDSSQRFYARWTPSPAGGNAVATNRVARDVSQFYHIVWVIDTTQSTSTDRIKLYINGAEETSWNSITYPSQNQEVVPAAESPILTVGAYRWLGSLFSHFDGYIAEMHYIDGQALDASNFGETDLLTNQWIPKKYVGTYGTNGFYLNFSNSASLGADSSGNSNDFTPTNLAATDQVLDSPTNNFCTFNPLFKPQTVAAAASFSEGNLKAVTPAGPGVGYDGFSVGTMAVSSGKWYFEYYIGTPNWAAVGVAKPDYYGNFFQGNAGDRGMRDDGLLYGAVVGSGLGTFTTGDVVGFAVDMDAGKMWISVNNTFLNSGNPASGTNEVWNNLLNSDIGASGVTPAFSDQNWGTSDTAILNCGQDSSFAGNKTAQNNTDGNGKGDFYYPPPAGYLALCNFNLSNPSIALPGDHFNTVLYSGNSTSQSITGVGFQPDFTWLKSRSAIGNHRLHNIITYGGPISGGSSGIKYLESNTTNSETSSTTKTLISLDSDGFSLYGDGGDTNQSSITYTSWNWKANGTGSTNTDGTITSTVSANPTAGFSIVTCTTLAGLQSVGHGLSQAPEIVIQKPRNSVQSWYVYYDFVDGSQDYLTLNTTAAAGAWGGSAATSTVFYENWGSGFDLVCYCFHSVEGYSKIGTYAGNNSTDGTFVYLGFTPAFILLKTYDNIDNWNIYDIKRNGYNGTGGTYQLRADSNAAGFTSAATMIDLVSNGVKMRTNDPGTNSSRNYLYMAFAESPFKYSNAR